MTPDERQAERDRRDDDRDRSERPHGGRIADGEPDGIWNVDASLELTEAERKPEKIK